MEEENIKYDTRDEIMAFLKRQREIHTIEECDNIEQIMFDRVRKVLDFRDLMKETRLNFKRTRKLLNKYAKERKKELDVKKLLKKQEEEIEMIESRYVASMIDLIIIVTKALGSELFSNNLTSIESWYEFEAEDLVFVNGFIKALKYWSFFDIDDNMMIRNQKGGVGKTTTTFSLGVALAKEGKKVLLIDADPQGDLTTCMGYYNQDELQNTIGTLMTDTIQDKEIKTEDAILHHKEGIDLIPSNLDLSALEMSLVNAMSREFTLKNSISSVKDKYDYILIDCMPSLGMITINALACSDKVIIPVQGEYLAAKGMGHLLKTVSKVHKQINPNLKIGGVLLTLVDKRTNLSKQVRDTLEENYGQVVNIYDTEIPKAINTAKSSSTGKSIFEFDKNSPVADSYKNLAKEVLDNERTKTRHETSKVR